MSKIHPRVKQLARDLGAPRTVHLTPEHRADWLRAFTRDIQVTVDSWMKGDLDDRTWPFQMTTEAKSKSRALTESGDSVAHGGTVGAEGKMHTCHRCGPECAC
jgi:hypothetical protein